MKRIPDHIVRDIVARTDIVRVVSQYVRLEKRGSRWVGLCPFHNEKTPSFGINEERGFFYCFGCKKGGDAITFIKEIEKCAYVEAVEQLADKAGITISYEGEDDPEQLRAARDRDALYELYQRIAGTFRHLLVSDPRGAEALAYVRSRGFSDAVSESFGLGYAPKDRTWLHRFLLGKSYSPQFLEKTGLFSAKYPGSAIFSDRLIFPIHDARGRVVAFGGRLLAGEGPKYLNSPETTIYRKHETLFGLSKASQAMRQSGEAILCEGYMDTIAFHAAGVANAVAPLGTSFTEGQASLIKRYAATVILGFDSDSAGIKAAEKAIGLAETAGLSVKILKISGAKDPAEILEKKGVEQLKKSSASTITSDEFLIENAMTLVHPGDFDSKSEAFKYLFPFIKGFLSDVKRDAFIQAAATRLGADPASVRNDFNRFLDKDSSRRTPDSTMPLLPAFVAGADAELIAAIASEPDLFEAARSEIGPNDFDEEALKDAFITMEECYRSGNQGVATISARLASEGLRDFILQKIAAGAYAYNTKLFVADGVRRIKERALRRQQQKIVARIREYDATRDGDELSLDDLMYEKMFLDAELTRIKEERHGRP